MAAVMSSSMVARVVTPASLKRTPARAFARAAVAKRSVAVSRSVVSVVSKGSDRPMWKPNSTAPAHLDGTLPGDYGFDPLGLGVDPDRLKWYQEAELQNGRWAMMAVAGILFTDAMNVGPVWYEAGAQTYDIPFLALLSIQFPVMGMLETKRLNGFQATGSNGFMNSFPFDPAGMNSPEMKVKEVKNARLAMVAFVGFMVQALVTRAGPLDGLSYHMADPFGYNITTTVGNIPNVL